MSYLGLPAITHDSNIDRSQGLGMLKSVVHYYLSCSLQNIEKMWYYAPKNEVDKFLNLNHSMLIRLVNWLLKWFHGFIIFTA